MLFVGNIHAIWVWKDVKTYDVTSNMYLMSSTLPSQNGEAYVDADNPDDLDFWIHTDLSIQLSPTMLYFIYDLGKNGVAGIRTDEGTKYRAIIYWTLNDTFDDNDSPNTYLKFYYELYYMLGSTKKIVGSYSYLIDDTDHRYDFVKVNHIVTSSSSVPINVALYLLIKVTLSGNPTLHEWDLKSIFQDTSLDKVTYQKYYYYPIR